MRDIGWIKMLTLFVCQYRSNPFNSQEIYDYRCLDGKVDILGNRYPQQGPQLTSTTPTTAPDMSSRGPPLFPGWVGAEVCKTLVSSFGPAKEVTLPTVKLPPDDNKPDKGNP